MSDEPRSYLDLPAGWERVTVRSIGPFVTRETLRRPDGSIVTWRSRMHRKAGGSDVPAAAVLFVVGSACFLVAALAAQWSPTPGEWIAPVYFIGSIFFTAAASCQYAEAVNVPHDPMRAGSHARFKPMSWEPGRIDWLAATIQLAGTVLFNVSTFAAMQRGLDTTQVDRRVWAPDALGSICFLVASQLAFAEVCHRWVCVRRRSLSWWIVALNLAGSIAFGISAIASLVEPSTSEPVNVAISNIGTAVGAFAFLVGAVLLVPESRRAAA